MPHLQEDRFVLKNRRREQFRRGGSTKEPRAQQCLTFQRLCCVFERSSLLRKQRSERCLVQEFYASAPVAWSIRALVRLPIQSYRPSLPRKEWRMASKRKGVTYAMVAFVLVPTPPRELREGLLDHPRNYFLYCLPLQPPPASSRYA